MKTLIVEDDFTNRLLLQRFLSRYGECHIAVNGKEAVEAFRESEESGQPYHLICMDIMMPVMNGQDALRQIRAIEDQKTAPNFGVKVIMTTALKDLKSVREAYHNLCDAYMVKPLDLGQLLGHLQTFRLVN